MGHIIWSSDDFAMGLCVEHSDDVDFWKVGEVSRRARPGMEQITGPVVRENFKHIKMDIKTWKKTKAD